MGTISQFARIRSRRGARWRSDHFRSPPPAPITKNKEQRRYAVYTRTFQIDDRRMYGLLFTIAGTP
jgi:hypothetical protein